MGWILEFFLGYFSVEMSAIRATRGQPSHHVVQTPNSLPFHRDIPVFQSNPSYSAALFPHRDICIKGGVLGWYKGKKLLLYDRRNLFRLDLFTGSWPVGYGLAGWRGCYPACTTTTAVTLHLSHPVCNGTPVILSLPQKLYCYTCPILCTATPVSSHHTCPTLSVPVISTP